MIEDTPLQETNTESTSADIVNDAPDSPSSTDLAGLFSAKVSGEESPVVVAESTIPDNESVADKSIPESETTTPVTAEKQVEAVTTVEVPQEKVEAYVETLFNGLKADQVKAQLAELATLKADPLAGLTEAEKEVIGVYRSGIDPQEYRALQSLDFAAMKPLDVLRHQHKRDNPTAPAHLIDALFEDEISSKYPSLESGDTEDLSYQKDLYKAQIEADKARVVLLAHQAQHRYQAPIPTQATTSEGSAEEQAEEARRVDVATKALIAHKTNVQTHLKAQNAISFEWKDGKQQGKAVNVEVGNPTDVAALMEDPGLFLGDFLTREMKNPDGTVNYAKLHRFASLVTNPTLFIQKAYESGGDAREIELRKEKRNTQTDASLATSTDTPHMGGLAAAFAQKVQTN